MYYIESQAVYFYFRGHLSVYNYRVFYPAGYTIDPVDWCCSADLNFSKFFAVRHFNSSDHSLGKEDVLGILSLILGCAAAINDLGIEPI